MTKIQLHFRVRQPFEEALIEKLADLHSVYGILRVKPDLANGQLTVEYDETRLREEDVEALLERAGVAVERQ